MMSHRLATALCAAVVCAAPSTAAAAPWATVNGEPLDDQELVNGVDVVNKRLGEGRSMSPQQRQALKSRKSRPRNSCKRICSANCSRASSNSLFPAQLALWKHRVPV